MSYQSSKANNSNSHTDAITVAELFAGVGGFRVGLERTSKRFAIVWSNQWEPHKKKQDASKIYIQNFGAANHSNIDIAQVPTGDLPEHDLLVGGFPCQDYSVARTRSQAKGLEGNKGTLWWEICRILKAKKPACFLFENVDRLLRSPASHPGRDFATILASLSDSGYIVEWRVINTAEYGMPQRRKRVFFMGYHASTVIHGVIQKLQNPFDWILHTGILAEAFEITKNSKEPEKQFVIKAKLQNADTPYRFENAGIMIDGIVSTVKTSPVYHGAGSTLGDVLLPDTKIPQEYFIAETDLDRWRYLKGPKRKLKVHKASGTKYTYAEGGMAFPDVVNKPSRTIITGEGGSAPSRCKHVVMTSGGRLRRLVPIELERLNMFPDDHTAGVSDIKRAFFMGNALVVGVVEKIGKALAGRM